MLTTYKWSRMLDNVRAICNKDPEVDKCNHKWKVIETVKFDSLLEKALDAGKDISVKNDTGNITKRVLVTVVQCLNCHDVKHITTIV